MMYSQTGIFMVYLWHAQCFAVGGKAYLLLLASKPQTGRSEMKRHSSGFVIGIIVSIAIDFGIVAGVWLGLQSVGGLGYEPGVLKAAKTGGNSATLDVSTYPDSHVSDADQG